MKKLILIIFVIFLTACCCCSPQAAAEEDSCDKYLLLSPGLHTVVIRVVPEEHGKLVGFGNYWMVIFDPDTGEADVRYGDKTYYATVTFGQIPPGYCGALHVRLDQEFWTDHPVF